MRSSSPSTSKNLIKLIPQNMISRSRDWGFWGCAGVDRELSRVGTVLSITVACMCQD